VFYTIVFIYLLSFMIALPDLLTHEVKTTKLLIDRGLFYTRDQLQPFASNENDAQVDTKNAFNFKFLKERKLSSNVNSAIGALVIISDPKMRHYSVLDNNLNFKLASIRYDYCTLIRNTLPKLSQPQMVMHQAPEIVNYFNENEQANVNQIEDSSMLLVNMTLHCLFNNYLNKKELIYNTMYFWLTQTFFISLPLFILTLVLITLTYTLRKKNTFYILNVTYLNVSGDESGENKPLTNKTLQGTVRNNLNANAPGYDTMFVVNNERIKLTKMHLTNIYMFYFMFLPYALTRLFLSLYSKERINMNLDLFIVFKLTFILFHFYLIGKFVTLIYFSYKFRLSLAKAFTFGSSAAHNSCCVCENDLNSRHIKIIKTSEVSLQKIPKSSQIKYKNYLNENKIIQMNEYDESLEFMNGRPFNSVLHQYAMPSKPSDI